MLSEAGFLSVERKAEQDYQSPCFMYKKVICPSVSSIFGKASHILGNSTVLFTFAEGWVLIECNFPHGHVIS